MNYRSTLLTLLLIAIMIATAPYIRSVYQKQMAKPEDSIVVTAPPQDLTEEALGFELVQKLEKKKKENGYIIETYREYELYRDAEGTITKEVPTSHLHYLRYKE